jgi:hypothetical protein
MFWLLNLQYFSDPGWQERTLSISILYLYGNTTAHPNRVLQHQFWCATGLCIGFWWRASDKPQKGSQPVDTGEAARTCTTCRWCCTCVQPVSVGSICTTASCTTLLGVTAVPCLVVVCPINHSDCCFPSFVKLVTGSPHSSALGPSLFCPDLSVQMTCAYHKPRMCTMLEKLTHHILQGPLCCRGHVYQTFCTV